MGFQKVLDVMSDKDKTWLNGYGEAARKQVKENAAKQTEEQTQAVFKEGLRENAEKREIELDESRAVQAAAFAADETQEQRRLDFLDSPEGMERHKASTAFIVYHGNPPPGAQQEASGDREAGVGSGQPQRRKGLFGFGILNV